MAAPSTQRQPPEATESGKPRPPTPPPPPLPPTPTPPIPPPLPPLPPTPPPPPTRRWAPPRGTAPRLRHIPHRPFIEPALSFPVRKLYRKKPRNRAGNEAAKILRTLANNCQKGFDQWRWRRLWGRRTLPQFYRQSAGSAFRLSTALTCAARTPVRTKQET